MTEPLVARQGGEGSYQILIQMPGIDDPERVKNTLNADSNLELRMVAQRHPDPIRRKRLPKRLKTYGGPRQYEVFHYREVKDGGASTEGWVVLEKTLVVTGLDMRDARAPVKASTSSYEIDFSFTPTGATRFGKATGKHIGDRSASF